MGETTEAPPGIPMQVNCSQGTEENWPVPCSTGEFPEFFAVLKAQECPRKKQRHADKDGDRRLATLTSHDEYSAEE